jgi:hypothetical protein
VRICFLVVSFKNLPDMVCCWFNYINSEGIAFPFFCIYLHTLYYKACKWLKYNGFGLKVKFRVVAQILKQSEFKHVILYWLLQSDPTV